MRNRAAILLVAAVAAASFAMGTAGVAGATVGTKSAKVLCKGNTKPAAVKAIKTAYDYYLNGGAGRTAQDKEPYLSYLSGSNLDPAFVAAFEASSASNAEASKTTSVRVNSVKCVKNGKSADVDFDLVLGGKPSPGLAPPGAAIYQDGTWKVTGLTQCNLTALGDASILTVEPCATILVNDAR
jgi:hypothetical protein